MEVINVVVLTISLVVSSLTFAEGGDRTFERLEQACEVSMAIRKPVPVAQEEVSQEKPTADADQLTEM
jgi:hypothetical protein